MDAPYQKAIYDVVKLRAQVLDAVEIMNALEVYRSQELNCCTLERKDLGTSNIYHKIGRLSKDRFFLARESRHAIDGELQRKIAEHYCRDLAYSAVQGRESPVALGVRLEPLDEESEPRYILLVEDFTNDGADPVIKSPVECMYSITQSGRKVYHDFQNDWSRVRNYIFMSEEIMINIK